MEATETPGEGTEGTPAESTDQPQSDPQPETPAEGGGEPAPEQPAEGGSGEASEGGVGHPE